MGTTVGSILISNFGIRYTYQVFGILSGATSLVYLILYHSVLKKLEHQRLSLAAAHSNSNFDFIQFHLQILNELYIIYFSVIF